MIVNFKIFENLVSDDILKNIKDRNIETIIVDDDIYVRLYHGTNITNYKKILKSGKFNKGTWFTDDFNIAKKYSLMTGTRKPMVFSIYVKLSSLYCNGYFVANHDLRNDKYGSGSVLYY